MAAEAPRDVADELYGAPLAEFTARRDARAKEMRKEDRAAANAVKRLRKPSVAAWAVNQLRRRSPDDLEALLAAGEALRQAQLGGGDRDAIRAAAADEREAVERLVGDAAEALRSEASGVSDATLEAVRGTLHAAASDDEARELIRRGALTEARQAVGLGGFGAFSGAAPSGSGSAAPGGSSTRKSTDPKPRKDGGRTSAAKEEAAAAFEAETERKRAAKERVKAARAVLRDAERDAAAADRARNQAAKALERAERAAAAAHEEVERRGRELEVAEDA
jgi:hypothetical protein